MEVPAAIYSTVVTHGRGVSARDGMVAGRLDQGEGFHDSPRPAIAESDGTRGLELHESLTEQMRTPRWRITRGQRLLTDECVRESTYYMPIPSHDENKESGLEDLKREAMTEVGDREVEATQYSLGRQSQSRRSINEPAARNRCGKEGRSTGYGSYRRALPRRGYQMRCSSRNVPGWTMSAISFYR